MTGTGADHTAGAEQELGADQEPGSPRRALYAIAPTLFGSTGGVDGGAMRAAAEWMVRHGIPDLLLTGSYGEFQSLTDDERVEVLEACRGVAGVGTVMACAASTSTEGTVRLGRRLADAGADLVMVAAPIAAEVTTAEVHRHFEVLGEELGDGLVVYNNPVFGRDLSPDELARIASLPAFRAVKQGTQSLPAMTRSIPLVREASGGRVRVLAASDLSAMAALAAGADGLTSTNSWAFPHAMAALVHTAGAGNWDRARRVVGAMEPYFELVRRSGQPRTVKAAMTWRGLPGDGRVRAPYVQLDGPETKELERVLEKCDMDLAQLGVELGACVGTHTKGTE